MLLEREQPLATRPSTAWRSIWLTCLVASVALAASVLGVHRSPAQVADDQAPAGATQEEDLGTEPPSEDAPMDTTAADADQLEALRQALLERVDRLRAEWRQVHGKVPEPLVDLDTRIRAAKSGPEIRELIALVQKLQLKPRADKRRGTLMRQLEALERIFVELDGEAPQELRALRAKLTDDVKDEPATAARPEDEAPDEREAVVVVKKLQERLQEAVEKRLAAEAPVEQVEKGDEDHPPQNDRDVQRRMTRKGYRRSNVDRLAGEDEGAIDVRGKRDDFRSPAPEFAQLDLVRLAEAYSDVRAEVEIAKARLAQVHEANSKIAGTLPTSEVAIHEVKYLAAERKLKLLRAIALAAMDTAKAELEAARREHLRMQRLAEKGYVTQEQAGDGLPRQARIESTLKILALIVAE